MPHALTLYPEHYYLEQRFSGTITLPDVLEANRTIFEHPAFHRHMRGIFDIREAQLSLKVADVFELIQRLQIERRVFQGDIAIVVTGTVPTALAMLYARRTNHAARVFSTVEAAREWLLTTAPALSSTKSEY